MKRSIAVLLALGMLPSGALHAAEASTTFQVTARVNAVCEVRAVDLNFGAYTSTAGSPLLAQTVVYTTCTPGSGYNIGLNEGSTGGTVNQRRMASGANTLNYQLYSDSARAVIWGNTSGTDTVAGNGTGVEVGHTVYGTVAAKQVVPAGDYADTITVRVYF